MQVVAINNWTESNLPYRITENAFTLPVLFSAYFILLNYIDLIFNNTPIIRNNDVDAWELIQSIYQSLFYNTLLIFTL